VRAPDGTIVYPTPTDTNGNAYSKNANGDIKDTVGRVPLMTITNCNNSVNQICYDVLNSQGQNSRYTLTLNTIPVATSFGQSDVTECSNNCTITVISSLGLPDGTSYNFSYLDGYQNAAAPGYGELTSIQLPTGGTSAFTYITYEDLYGQRNRWVNTYAPSVGGVWTFTPQVVQPCAAGLNSCQQQLTRTSPAGDDTVFQFLINHGAWKSLQSDYSGSSTGSGTLLRQETSQFNFNQLNSAVTTYINGVQTIENAYAGQDFYLNNLQTTTTVPLGPGGSLVKQVQYNYDTQNADFGALLSVKEWNFYPSAGELPATPDRSTYYTYRYQQANGQAYANANILRAPATVTVCNNSGSDPLCGGAGSAVAKTAMSYDTTTPSGVHGNLSQVQKWVGGPSWLTTGITYDNTGNTTQVTDPAGNSAHMGYGDKYYVDSTNPPSYGLPTTFTPSAATNAYLTSVTLPLIGTSNFGYFYNTGKRAFSQDANGAARYEHYLDPFDRLTHVYTPPIVTPSGSNPGWSLLKYTTPTQTDAFTSISSLSPATTCTATNGGCRQDETLSDAIGRPVTNTLVSDPEGSDHVDTTYDSQGRAFSVTNPYRNTSDSTFGLDSFVYDGLNRIVKTTHSADNTSSQILYGPAANGIGLSSPLCPTSTCGSGYPSVAIDETGRVRQAWTDAFGRVIEVDTPGAGSSSATPATVGTGLVTITGSEQSFNNGTPSSTTVTLNASLSSSDSGTVSITANGVTDTVSYPVTSLSPFQLLQCSTTSACAIATALSYALSDDPKSSVSVYAHSSTSQLCGPTDSACYLVFTSTQPGGNTNYPFAISVTHTAGSGSISATPSTGTLTGGTDNWVYDTGTLSVMVNGQTLSQPVSYGQSSTPASLATSLATAINSSSSLGSLVTASASGTAINLVAKASGVSSNYSISASSSTASVNPPHAFQTPSFDISASWGDLTGGQNAGSGGTSVAAAGSATVSGLLQSTAVGTAPSPISFTVSGSEQSTTVTMPLTGPTTVYDQGYISITLNPCNGSTCAAGSTTSPQAGFQVFTATAAFGQGTSPTTLARNLACVLNSADSPVTANATGTTVTLTLKSVSANLPSYNYQVIPNTFFNYVNFGKPSFTIANNNALAAGQTFTINIAPNPAPNVLSPEGDRAWVTINGVSAWVVDTSRNAGMLATNLANAINQNISSVSASVVNGTSVQVAVNTSGSYSFASFIQPQLGWPWVADFVETITPPAVDDVNRTATVMTDSGTAWITVNGYQASVGYGPGSTAQSVATALANVFNTQNSSLVTAWTNGPTVNLVASAQGYGSNYAISAGSTTSQSGLFAAPSFTVTTSGPTLTGGVNAGGLSLTPSSSRGTFYQYDVLGNLLSVAQGGQARTYTYDALNRVTSYCTPETGASGSACGTTNIYYTNATSGLCAGDPAVPCRITDPLGVTTTFQYDQLNRLTSKSYSDGTTPMITYCYDGQNAACLSSFSSANGNGRRTAMKDGSGATGWSYDPDGNVITKQRTTSGVTQTFSYTHNLDGSVATLGYPSGRTIAYSYSNAQRTLSAIDTASGINYATGATYSPNGALASVSHGATANGISENYTYNHRMQLTRILDSTPTSKILDLEYSLNQGIGNNGNIASITNNIDNTRTQSFAYDALNRLAAAQSQASSGGNCWGLSFGIDSLANLNSETVTKCSANALSVSVNAKNQITNTGFAYDSDGRLTNDGTYTYAYDAEDHLTAAAGVTYSYDGNGLRVMKSNGTIDWRGAGGNILVETNLTGGLQNEYIFFNGARVARRDSSGNGYYLFTDHLGSTRAATNATGSTCYQADFSPYGGELTPSGFTNSCAPNYRFTGYEYDSETQNNYALARYYNPHFGRFLSADPIDGDPEDSQSWNKYAYVGNNAANFVDPAGMDDSGIIFVDYGSIIDPNVFNDMFFHSWSDFEDWFGGFWDTVSAPFISLGNFFDQAQKDPVGASTYLGMKFLINARNFVLLTDVHTSHKVKDRIMDQYVGTPAEWDQFYQNLVSGDFRTWGHVGGTGFNIGVSAVVGEAFLAEGAGEGIISNVARQQYSKGATQLFSEGFMSPAEYRAYMRNPARNSRFLGTAVHRATATELERLYPGRFAYNLVGPDFYDAIAGESIELTTPGQVSAHVAKGGAYATSKYATYP
jgi:RHS repeat-associated protein